MEKNVGKGIIKDIKDRKDEYKSALGDIAQDLSNGEIPTMKIAKLVGEGVYNGVGNASLEYIENFMNKKEKTKNSKILKPTVLGIGKALKGMGNDVIFKKKDLKTAFFHRTIKGLTNPYEKWIDKKFDDQIILKHYQKGVLKSLESMATDILTEKTPLFKINRELNGKWMILLINLMKILIMKCIKILLKN